MRDVLTRPSVMVSAALLGVLFIVLPLAVLAASRSSNAPSAAEWLRTMASPASKTVEGGSSEATTAAAPATSEKTPTPTDPSGHRTEMIAFYANFDDVGYASLEENIDKIDVLMPMWYHLDSSGRITVDDPAKQARVMSLIKERRPDLKVMPILNNYDKSTEQWNAPAVGKMLANPETRTKIAKAVVTVMKRDGFDGVNIDFESFTKADRGNLVAFMAELYPLAKKADLTVSMDVIVAGAAYDHVRLSRYVDYLVPMMYDEHWKTSGPGAIASQGWYERTLTSFYQKVPPEKVVIGIGTYTYDWGKPGARAKSNTHADAVRLSRQYKKPMNLSATAMNSTFTYTTAGVKHQVWVLDAISAFNQMSAAYSDKPRGYAVWRMGAEDPAIWDVIPRRDTLDASVAESLNTPKRTVTYDEARGLIVGGQTKP